MTLFKQLTLAMVSLAAFALPASAGTLDDYYLSAFGAQPGSALEKAVLLQDTTQVEPAHCGTPLKHALQRDWNQLEPDTQKVLTKQLAAPTLSGTELTYTSTGGHFKIHYTTSGSDAPNIALINQYTGLSLTSAADWAAQVGTTMEQNLTTYIGLGYHAAPTVGNAPYDVYLHDLASQGLYGQTTSTQAVPSAGFANAYASYMELDKDFTNSIFVNTTGGPYTPLQSMQITTAHEYQHAIQYGYNYYFDIWYAEATSTWYEDELYDGVNQLYNYLVGWLNNSTRSLDLAVGTDATTVGAGYGRWIFNRYLAEEHGTAVVRNAWEKLATLNSSNGQDIPMVPVLETLLSAGPYYTSLGDDFFGLAKRFYTRDWTTHTSEISRIHTYIPINIFSTYPVTASSLGSAGTAPAVTLPHYSFAFYKFVPSSSVPTLTITINATTGIRATAFLKTNSTIQEFPFTAVNGTTVSIPNFSTATEAVLLIANAVNVDGHQASFSTNGSVSGVTEPANTPASSLTASSGSSGGGSSGCFVATAAYGSYLHPQVKVLRDFRDHYLLTNAPGRAFVAFYYHVSPPLAAFIARHDTLRLLVRLLLTPLVYSVAYPLAAGTMVLLSLAGGFVVVRRKTCRCRVGS